MSEALDMLRRWARDAPEAERQLVEALITEIQTMIEIEAMEIAGPRFDGLHRAWTIIKELREELEL